MGAGGWPDLDGLRAGDGLARRLGPFESDRACIGLHRMSGQHLPAHNVPEWKYLREPQRAFESKPALDIAEIESSAAAWPRS